MEQTKEKNANNFKQQPQSPKLPMGVEGVEIFIPAKPNIQNRIEVYGVCALKEATAQTLNDTILDNVSIICSYHASLQKWACALTAKCVVFPDDIIKANGMHTAYFNLDLMTRGLPDDADRYFIFAVCHTYLSKVLTVKR